MNLQSAIHFLYPPQCLTCGVETSADFALCGNCWRDTPFISGLVCESCGLPLPGEDQDSDARCDTCITAKFPWHKGRAALMYEGTARRMVLALKHGDRHELVKPMARWMAQAGRNLASHNTLVVPVPLHPRRLFSRRFNQSALMAQQISQAFNASFYPDLLQRARNTRMQEGMSAKERFENQKAAFTLPAKHKAQITGQDILLIDDVLTSGATLSGCAETLLKGGAAKVNVLVLARVARGA